MSERENIRHAADTLAAFALSCRMSNTLQWMDGFAKLISAYLEAIDDPCRVVADGRSLKQVSPEEHAHFMNCLENDV